MTVQQAIQLGLEHHNAGRLQAAEQIYRQVLAQSPEHPEALHLLGVLALQIGRSDVAVDLLQRAVKVDAHPLYLSNLAEAHRHRGELHAAEAAARASIERAPNLAVAYANLGTILVDQKQLNEAEEVLRRAIQMAPEMPGPLTTLGALLLERGDLDAAIDLGRRAVAGAPRHAIAHNNLATALEKKGDLSEAEKSYRFAIECDPRFVEALNNLGSLLRKQSRIDEAMSIWNQALAIRPDFASAQWNLALATLARGDYKRGWPLYESRFRCEHSQHSWREYGVPRWQGEPLVGKTLFLHSEQGIGDTIQFARFIPILAQRGARVILGCHAELIELMRTVPGIADVVAMDASTPTFDAHLQLMSLPFILRTTLDTIPSTVPYLSADPDRAAQWARRFADVDGLKVGLVWAGRSTHHDDAFRSMALATLQPLAHAQGVHFFSLQKGEAADEIERVSAAFPISDLGRELNDFRDTAAVVENLDLLISVDTSPAHLAGALGKPVWTLLASSPDFRWMYDREDTPWYPTMRLFRQKRRGEWSDVIVRVVDELRQLSKP
jgi:tetratricopeptide (TPR) repeat protein/ADP-heptose:LPS heptosyltransferase